MVEIKNRQLTTTLREELKLMKNSINQRMGVYVLVSHLIITLAVIVLYGLSMFSGKDTSVLEGLLFVVFGYWFGSITKDSLKSAEKITDNVNANAVTQPQETIRETVVIKEDK